MGMHLVEVGAGCPSATAFNSLYFLGTQPFATCLLLFLYHQTSRAPSIFPGTGCPQVWLLHSAASQFLSRSFLCLSVLSLCMYKVKRIVIAASWVCYKHRVLFVVLVEGCDVADWRNTAAIIILPETGNPKAQHLQ